MHLHVCIQQFWTQLYIACRVKPAAPSLEPSPAKSASMDPTKRHFTRATCQGTQETLQGTQETPSRNAPVVVFLWTKPGRVISLGFRFDRFRLDRIRFHQILPKLVVRSTEDLNFEVFILGVPDSQSLCRQVTSGGVA